MKRTRMRTFRPRSFASQGAQGFTLIEALVASLILGMCIMALVSMWQFAFRMTTKADYMGESYIIGRHAMERVKLSGYEFAPEGTVTLYYDRAGGSESTAQQSQHTLQAVTTVVSSPGYPSYDATRTVTISVNQITTGETLYSSGMTLCKKGI